MLGIFLIIASCFIWAIDTLFRYPLLKTGISATHIVFFEHLFLLLIFFPTFYRAPLKFFKARPSHYLSFLVIGVFGSALATLAFTSAFMLINPSVVILLQKLQPLVAIVMAHLVVGERFNRQFFLWAAICLLGSGLIAFQDMVQGISALDFSVNFFADKALKGYGLALLAVIGWGASTVFGKKLSLGGFEEKEIMAGRYTLGLITLAPFALFDPTSFDGSFVVWRTILIMALLTGVISMYLYYQGLKRISARLCALLELSFPFAAVLVNWIFLKIPVTSLQLLGGLLLLLGSTIIQLKKY